MIERFGSESSRMKTILRVTWKSATKDNSPSIFPCSPSLKSYQPSSPPSLSFVGALTINEHPIDPRSRQRPRHITPRNHLPAHSLHQRGGPPHSKHKSIPQVLPTSHWGPHVLLKRHFQAIRCFHWRHSFGWSNYYLTGGTVVFLDPILENGVGVRKECGDERRA
jgi:hypothetical protein